MSEVLLTGFEPFGDYEYNPTQDLVHRMRGRELLGAKVMGVVLPCSYSRATEIVYDLVENHRPDMIVSFGLASRIPAVRIETRGLNIMDSRYPDSEGVIESGRQISEVGNDYYNISNNANKISASLGEVGIRADISDDAEGFVCNALIYKLAMRLDESGLRVPFTFIHTPWTTHYTGIVPLESGKAMVSEDCLDKVLEVAVQTELEL